jgi:hypothetical protein
LGVEILGLQHADSGHDTRFNRGMHHKDRLRVRNGQSQRPIDDLLLALALANDYEQR